MECYQEVLILWNCYKYVCLIKSLHLDRKAACDQVRTKVQMEATITVLDRQGMTFHN